MGIHGLDCLLLDISMVADTERVNRDVSGVGRVGVFVGEWMGFREVQAPGWPHPQIIHTHPIH